MGADRDLSRDAVRATLRVEGLPAGTVVRTARGVEAISRPFRFEVELLVPNVERGLEGALIGRGATLELTPIDPSLEPRRFVGVILAATLDTGVLRGRDDGARRLVVRLGPRLSLLARDRASRVYQHQSVPEVVRDVLARWGIRATSTLALEHPQRPYVLQYQESSLRFVERLLAEVGVSYVVEAEGDDAVVRLFDAPSTVPRTEPDAPIPFVSAEGLAPGREAITSLETEARVRPTHVVLTEFDEVNPRHELEASGQIEPIHELIEHYDHHGEHVDLDVHERRAEARLRELRRRATGARGASRVLRLSAGRSFRLEATADGGDDREHTVTEVRHVARAPELHEGAVPSYENRFRSVEHAVWPRARARRRKLQETLLTATVVGPAGQEIHTDPLGRVRVQFHWDREGARDETSSCWIRVAQPWAGAGYGFQFIPRIGMEVVVGFLGGDVDRPLVLGCVPNAIEAPPFPLPRERTKSGVRSSSTPGGGGHNELSFEDRQGYERVYLRAERDLEELVQRDHYTEVRHDRRSRVLHDDVAAVGHDAISSVDGQRVEIVQGDKTTTVGGTLRVSADGDRVESTAGSLGRQVHGDATTVVQGGETRLVAGAALHHYGTSWSVEASSAATLGSHDRLTLAGPRVDVAAGTLALSASDALRISAGRDGGRSSLDVSGDGDARLELDRSLDVRAGERLTLRVGKTVITVSEDGVDIDAARLKVQGREVALVTDQSSLVLDDKLEARANEVRLSSAASSTLELGPLAKLDGAQIAFGGATAATRRLKQEREAALPTTPKLTVQLFDSRGEPAQGCYELAMPGYSQAGTLSGGRVEVPAFPGADTCRIRWGAEGEAGPFAYERLIYLGFPEDPDEALRRKLSNLGHEAANLRAAVADFESKTGKEVTGDPAQVAAVVDDHHRTATSVKTKTSKELS